MLICIYFNTFAAAMPIFPPSAIPGMI